VRRFGTFSAFLDGELDVWQRRRVEAHCTAVRLSGGGGGLEEMIAALTKAWVQTTCSDRDDFARLPDVGHATGARINWVVSKKRGQVSWRLGDALGGLSLGR